MCNSLLCGCGSAFLEFEHYVLPKMKGSESKKKIKKDKEREWEGFITPRAHQCLFSFRYQTEIHLTAF